MLFTVFLVFNVVQSAADVSNQKLIRVNEWQDITIDGSTNEDALLDFHLFATCEKFTVLFMTEESESTRFSFSYNDAALKKIDVESVEDQQVQIPNMPRMMGTCREKQRKVLRMKFISSNDTLAFKVDDQLIKRPFDSSRLRVLIPQSVACCLIRALFLDSSEELSNTPTKYQIRTRSTDRIETTTSLFRSSTQIVKTATTRRINYSRVYTLGKEGRAVTDHTTSIPKPESSWTHSVNKQWSTTFVLCSLVVLSIMLFLAVFGTFTVFYLMKKPKDGKSPFAIDS